MIEIKPNVLNVKFLSCSLYQLKRTMQFVHSLMQLCTILIDFSWTSSLKDLNFTIFYSNDRLDLDNTFLIYWFFVDMYFLLLFFYTNLIRKSSLLSKHSHPGKFRITSSGIKQNNTCHDKMFIFLHLEFVSSCWNNWIYWCIFK